MAGLREPRGARLGHVYVVFQTNPEFAVNANHRFIGKAHTLLNWREIALYHVGVLMHVQADAMTRAMRQAWCRVTRTKPRGLDHGARCNIDGLTRSADLGGRKCGELR